MLVKVKKQLSILLSATGLIVIPVLGVRAVGIIQPKTVSVGKIIINTVNWLLLFSAGLAVLFILYAGIKYITSLGNPESIKSAKSTLTNAVIGLIIIVLAFAIVTFISSNVKSIVT